MKLSAALYTLKSVKDLLPTSVLKTLYHSLFYPCLTYGILLLAPTYKIHLQGIISQTRGVRVLSTVDRLAHTHDLLYNLNVLSNLRTKLILLNLSTRN